MIAVKNQNVRHLEACNMAECSGVYFCPHCRKYVGKCLRRFRPKEGEETSWCQCCYEG